MNPKKQYQPKRRKVKTAPPKLQAKMCKKLRRLVLEDDEFQMVTLRLDDLRPRTIKQIYHWLDSAYVRNNPGGNYFVVSLRATDLNDPDPGLLSAGISGFKEDMQYYSYYRVEAVFCRIKICNLESFPVLYGVVFSQQNLNGVIGSRDDAINALETNLTTGLFSVAGKGGVDTDAIKFVINPWDILGNRKQYEAEFNYSGVGLSSPTTPLWMNIIVASPTGTVLANGVMTTLALTFEAKLFGRTNIRA